MRIAVFIDYWNFVLTFEKKMAEEKKLVARYKSDIDWQVVGPLLANHACPVLSVDPKLLSYQGVYVYTSYDPANPSGEKFARWANTWLNRQPGVNVAIRERKRKSVQKCTTCHEDITHCPHDGCGQELRGTTEKGIDTLLVTDVIRLAVTDSYDSAVIVTSDADMVPAVQFVQQRGKKVIQAGFPPGGQALATACWGSYDIKPLAGQLERQRA
ncbi:NYN domain-containing protein [Stenotrophomonas maltophilia]|uniref:NYN domain-containing protein n=1 Tax=Stenotrophomonas maltophilia TaxID=40324 RepID=UPI00131B3D60|nr:NYN domain-containing protein [Stenotrophomonas maltophilia]